MEERKVALPYVNNAKAVLITVAIGVASVFLFSWPDGINFEGALVETLYCVVITTIIDLIIVYHYMKKFRATGHMPTQVPVNKYMQKLPKNPFALGAICIVIFAVVTVAINALVLWAFGMQSMSFIPWMTYKVIYSMVLSIKITEFCIFRYVQPDWTDGSATVQDYRQTGAETSVKDPLPKLSVFKELFGSVTMNIALNVIIGSLTGGVLIAADQSIVIHPTTIEGIPITGFIFGFITGFLTSTACIKAINEIILTPERGLIEKVDTMPIKKLYTWMPKRKGSLVCFTCLCMMIFSSVALWAIMAIFEISIMNFYQFNIFITAYAAVIGMPLKFILVQRCLQPDYIHQILDKAKAKKEVQA